MSDIPQQGIYPDDERSDVRVHLPEGVTSAVDVGCSRGGFGRSLRAAYGEDALIWGVEAVPEQAAIARVGHGFDRVVDGYFPSALAGVDQLFDLICFTDVLEHILEPGEALRACHDHLTPGGRVLASIPNIGHVSILTALARGEWTYTDDGLLDRTHVRFFTRKSMVDLFEQAGFEVESCVGINSVRDTWATDPLAPRRLVKFALARVLRDAQFLQFVIVARSPLQVP